MADRDLSPGRCATLGCLARTKPAPFRLAEVRLDGRDFIVWIGEINPLWLAPSGRACYVFDGRGRLVMWTPDCGEGGEAERFAAAAWRAEPADLDALLAQIGQD